MRCTCRSATCETFIVALAGILIPCSTVKLCREEPMDQGSPTKYLYIVGRGYSGSTIFSLLLGQSSAVENEGEIVFGFRPGFEERRCVQRDLFNDCHFWSEVKRAFERRTGTAFADADRKSVV